MLHNFIESPTEQLLLPEFNLNQIKVYLKRDDLLHPFISGNKWRKLKYVLADARLKNKNHLVSFGGAYSNHLLALACAGATDGFKTTAFVRGDEVQNYLLGLCKTFGMELIFTSRSAYQNKLMLYDNFAEEHNHTYFIDEGGKGELAAKGCAEIINHAENFTHVICAVGTGTTLAGLAKAAKIHNLVAEGICVLKGAEKQDDEIAELAGYRVKVHHEFSRGGYAKTDAELWQFIEYFSSHTGILIDQVYTAKMLMAVKQLIAKNYFLPGSKLLLIHTGGTFGLLSRFIQ